MNFVTFFIQQQSITVFVVELGSQINKVLFEQTALIEQENIAYSLQKLNKEINHFINSKGQKIVYRIILANDLVMQRDVQLPKVQLSDYELEQYIKNLLPKIFHTSNRLAHDYMVLSNDNINHQISQQSAHLMVFAYEQRLIDEYSHLLYRSKIDFIGVVDEFNPLSDKSILSNITTLLIINGINFLPWRERLKQHKRNRFLVELISGLLILSCIVIFQYNQTIIQIQNVISLNNQLHLDQANKSQQLLAIIQLDKQVQ